MEEGTAPNNNTTGRFTIEYTPETDGWLTIVATQNKSATDVAAIDIALTDGHILSRVYSRDTSSGDRNIVGAPVKKGVTYLLEYFRCSSPVYYMLYR